MPEDGDMATDRKMKAAVPRLLQFEQIQGCAIRAADGELGTVSDLYFDDGPGRPATSWSRRSGRRP
jgi:hypothetical protein